MTESQTQPNQSQTRRPSLKVVAAGVLLVAIILAGVVSFYAASSPDGLTKVSEDKGFASSETEHDAADGPFAGYDSSFIDDERLSGGVAGIVGVAVVLLLGTGLAYVVKRRPVDERSA